MLEPPKDPTSRAFSAPVPVAAISKHLCGVATDLALRCLDGYQARGGKVQGVAIALCCHGACHYEDYVGRAWWEDTLGLSAAHFEQVRQMTAWATGCRPAARAQMKERGDAKPNVSQSDDKPGKPEDGEGSTQLAHGSEQSGPTMLKEGEASGAAFGAESFTPEKMLHLGRMCKQLIDAGRLAYVREVLGLQADLVQYCLEEVSAENCLLVAWARDTPDVKD
ncbi:hypothetical protein CYMTET_3968 [Cymbomonas tetramitiformis]|nr:hypothetical protein CYMTET_3968 [Cymbomonas tetramitiformis]